MKRLMHNLLCTISRRYRLAHCRHVDELPPHISRRLREECREIDPHVAHSGAEMWQMLEEEWRREDEESKVSTSRRFGKAAVFA